jgi:HPt (histidine-containing phosphotransfer) domain-containing protein
MPDPLPPTPADDFKGVHYQHLKSTLPRWIKNASVERVQALKDTPRRTARPYPQAPNHPQLKAAVAAQWHSQNSLDQKFRDLNDVQAFAEPLLKSALVNYGDIDLRSTFIRLYTTADLAWWVRDSTGGVTSRTVSLLDAALHNFAAADSFVDHAFLSAEDPRGQRDTLTLRHRSTGAVLTAEHFKAICRALDIGARYQVQLKEVLGFNNRASARTLRHEVITSQKTALSVAAHLGLAKGDIQPDAHTAMLQLIADQAAHLDGRRIKPYTLSLMDIALTGIVVFCPSPDSPTPLGRLLAYVPEDPEHPLKEYRSPATFMQELTRQLRNTQGYQRFFSQFVAQSDRGYFFAGLKARLSQVRWHQKAATDPGPTWKDTPVDTPNLQFRLQDIDDDYQNRSSVSSENDLWNYQYRRKLNKVLNDAQELAVSTALADRHARWAWWDNLEKILSDILNAALLVATPFVPVLGELVLVYSAYQLADDVFEGLVDWSEGQALEATEHLLGVVDNVLQLALFGAGSALGAVAQLKLSAFVEGLKPVQMPNGTTRLWNPDLAPYAQKNLTLPRQATIDTRGLHHHEGKAILALDNRHYEVKTVDDDSHRIPHPDRPDAYAPKVVFNGHGAFVHEAEQPRSWDSTTLMRRLGPRTQAFSDIELQQIRRISATDDDQLRGVYVYNQPPPLLFEATLKRYEARQAATTAVDTLRSGVPLPTDPSSAWFEQTVTELPGWPEHCALQVFTRADLSGDSRTYSKPGATPTATLKVSLGEVMSGQLPARVLGFLDDNAVGTLLGRNLPETERLQALRDLLAEYVKTQTEDIGEYIHQIKNQSSDPSVRRLHQQLPGLDASLAHAVIKTANRLENQAIGDNQLPLRLLNQAQELNFVDDANQAYAGFYAAWPVTAGTERLVLNTLKLHSDAFADLHLEIRDQTLDGPLRGEVGPAAASQRRILVRKNSQGYEVFDQTQQRLNGLNDLYESLLHAVPVPGQKPGQGAELKRWLMEKLESLAERRRVLAQRPIRTTADTQTSQLLRGPGASRPAFLPPTPEAAHHRQVLELLFPSMDEERLNHFVENIGAGQMRTVVNRLRIEKQQLQKTLESWKRTANGHPKGSPAYRQESASRHHVADVLYRCWEDRMTTHRDPWGHVQGGAELDLRGILLPNTLPELTAGFEHVTSLTMADNRFGAVHEHFLKAFPSLRSLDLGYNDLPWVPEAVGEMRMLRYLNLRDNHIQLGGQSLQRLAKLHRLENLQLQSNPLGATPDISRMPNLRDLLLNQTQTTTWPNGLFSHPRNRSFVLDLRGNPITQVPELTPGTPQAEIIARARLDRNALNLDQRERYEGYRVAAGLDPNRTYEPKGDSDYWLDAMDPQLREQRKTLWNAVEQEHGSQGLFEVLKSLEREESVQTEEDRQRLAANRPELAKRVWQLILAASVDSTLRETLFRMSSFPGLCADGGAQIFNDMGIEVLATEAQRYSLTDEERAGKLVTLAKGRAHMKLLAEVIQEDVARRLRPVAEGGLGQRLRSDVRAGVPGEVDEVEIYLAYQTSLAEKLDLPWLSDHMLYRLTADVPQPRIDEAYVNVLEMAEGDGLVNQMLLEHYWEQYLRDSHDREYRDNELHFSEQLLKVDQLQETQAKWARSQGLEPAQKEALRHSLKGLADALEVPESVVFSGNEMSDDGYNRLLNDLGYSEKQWMRRLTREALANAAGLSNRRVIESTHL